MLYILNKKFLHLGNCKCDRAKHVFYMKDELNTKKQKSKDMVAQVYPLPLIDHNITEFFGIFLSAPVNELKVLHNSFSTPNIPCSTSMTYINYIEIRAYLGKKEY